MPIISNFPSGNVKKDELIIPEGLPEIGREGGLEAYTWAEISAISAANLGDKYFGLGETKSVLVNGTVGTVPINQTLYVFILGFNHNREIEGDGITFGCFKESPDSTHIRTLAEPWGASPARYTFAHNYTCGLGSSSFVHWSNSDLRYDILGSTNRAPDNYDNGWSVPVPSSDENGMWHRGYDADSDTTSSPVSNTLMAAFPEALRMVMKPITKINGIYIPQFNSSTSTWNRSEINALASLDYLPLMSDIEIKGVVAQNRNYIDQQFQKQYDYFKALGAQLNFKPIDNDPGYTYLGVRSSVNNATFSAVSHSSIGRFNQYGSSAAPYSPISLFPIFKV